LAKKVSAAHPEGKFIRLPRGAVKSGRSAAEVVRDALEQLEASQRSKAAIQRTFLDSNILLYADDAKDERKRDLALALILHHRQQRTGVVSVQVLQEYFANATSKLKVSIDEARYKVQFHSRFQVVEPSALDVVAAIDLHSVHRISFWDAMILHSAKQAGCRVLLTEDLQHRQTIDGVRIVNPFL
jgi:predicted nucleic acid-binding protein